MKKILLLLLTVIHYPGEACTNLIVTRGASADSATYLVYTNDGEWLYQLDLTPAKNHDPNDSIDYTSRYGITGKISQVPATFAVVGFQMNEFQVAIGETTFTGREELWNKSKFLEYWHLMKLALERSKTAREAIGVITGLVEEYGYASEGESFSIIDPNEAWILEMVGTGTGGEGAVWVAVKIPDGFISAHANMARIGEFPLDDPENCLYSDNIISFAVEKGYYQPAAGAPFRFNEVYNPPSPDRLKYCETRIWSLFSRAAPSQQFSSGFHRGIQGAERYPLWIKPDKKLDLSHIFGLIRDHYEGTEFDMTNGLAAGPYGSPNFNRPLFWQIDSVEYSWERSVSTINTAFSYVAQTRNYLPDKLGGVVWFGVDDTYFTCYVPIFAGVTEIPHPFTVGDLNRFSWESMFWVFNFVSNYANLKYSYMIKDIQPVQNKLEKQFIGQQDSVIAETKNLEPELQAGWLTKYSSSAADKVYNTWIELGEYLLTKYNDGYVKDENGEPKEVGYPVEWKKSIIKDEPERYKIPDRNSENKIDVLPY
jgi:dipeptidase